MALPANRSSSAEDQVKGKSQHDRIDQNHQPCGGFLERCDRTGFGLQVFHVAVKVDHRGEDQPQPECDNHRGQVVDQIDSPREKPRRPFQCHHDLVHKETYPVHRSGQMRLVGRFGRFQDGVWKSRLPFLSPNGNHSNSRFFRPRCRRDFLRRRTTIWSDPST